MPPPRLLLFGGDWNTYEAELHRIFMLDLVQSDLQFRNKEIRCRQHPVTDGRWATFWHLTQEGPDEDERTPEFRRCERIRWIRWVIENGVGHPEIDEWQNKRGPKINTLLWYQEEYLVVLGERTNSWLLITAYCTNQRFRIGQLQRERDNYRIHGLRE